MRQRPSIQVLVVDDEKPTRVLMERELPQSSCMVVAVQSGEEALEVLSRQDFDVVLLDLKMPGLGGMETLRRLRRSGVSAEVVVLTGHPEVDSAIEAMKLGAYDYLTKPFKLSEVEAVLRRAAEKKRLQEENTALRRMVTQGDVSPVILGESRTMRSILEMVERVAASHAPVLISGETGTGKGLIARAIHQASPRADRPFLVINCSAFQDQLLESELFGHEKGAFTGAVSAKPGLFEVAHGGTLFLDEVAEMSPAMQAKLLQVLDTGELRRVGGTRLRRVDTRIFAATNKDLHREVRGGRFREDLFFRLNVVSLAVPPLRDRKEDIPPLIEHFLHQFRLPGQRPKVISPQALQLLMEYSWPGNVRELANTIERLVLLAPGTTIGPDDLPANIRPPAELPPREADAPLPLAEVERLSIIRALTYTRGKKAPAARLLGIDVKTLTHKIRLYNIHIC
ncbi:MAG: sigma-54-dependent transcriptional regulator [Candidatus Methylomirabilales bacterium]